MIYRIELSDDAEYTISNCGQRIEITRGSATLHMRGGGGGGTHAGTATGQAGSVAGAALTPSIRSDTITWANHGANGGMATIAESDGYVLQRTIYGFYVAGCRGPWTPGEALRHWGQRNDTRARIFSEAIKRVEGL